MSKSKKLRNLSAEDLRSRLIDLRKELMKINAQRSTGTSLKNPSQLRETKKAVARILTLIKNREETK